MLSISQFTEKFLEQNLSKFLYHIEVIVRCRRRSGLSFLFTHFIVFTSFPPCSPLTISLSSLSPVISTSFRLFLTPWFTSFSSCHSFYSPWYFLFSPFPSSFFSLSSHSFLLHSLPASFSYILPRLLPLLPPPPPPAPRHSLILILYICVQQI